MINSTTVKIREIDINIINIFTYHQIFRRAYQIVQKWIPSNFLYLRFKIYSMFTTVIALNDKVTVYYLQPYATPESRLHS